MEDRCAASGCDEGPFTHKFLRCHLTVAHLLVVYYSAVRTAVQKYLLSLENFLVEAGTKTHEEDDVNYVLKEQIEPHIHRGLFNAIDKAGKDFLIKVSEYFGLQPSLTSFQLTEGCTHDDWLKQNKHRDLFRVFGCYMGEVQDFRKSIQVALSNEVHFEGLVGNFCNATELEKETEVFGEDTIGGLLEDISGDTGLPPGYPDWDPNDEGDMRYAIELVQKENGFTEEN